ncbi:MAG: phosphate acyltransferase [Clostridiaceae bacterium]
MFQSFEELLTKAQEVQYISTIAIAAGDDFTIIQLVAKLIELKLCRVIIAGDKNRIEELAENLFNLNEIEIIDEPDRIKSCLSAVQTVSQGKAQILVKGNVNTSDFLRAVLNKEVGLRSGRKLNVLSCYEVPGEKKLFFIADGGMMIAPTLNDKIDILNNCVPALQRMGIKNPKVALLAANEKVSNDMPATTDAKKICDLASENQLPEGIYEGPIAFDVAMSPEAAAKKGIDSKISGDVDLFLVPNIETGNCLGKAIAYYAKGTMAGLVLGATKPIIMSSRASPLKGKIASIAWAILVNNENQNYKSIN